MSAATGDGPPFPFLGSELLIGIAPQGSKAENLLHVDRVA